MPARCIDRSAARALSALARALLGLRARGWRRLRPLGDRLAARCEAGFRRGSFEAERAGFRWTLDLADNLQRRLFVRGAYEPGLVRFLCGAVKPGDRVIDVGANVGVHALPLARRLGELGDGEVVCFEPSEAARARLRRHLAINGLAEWVRVVPSGLASRPRRASLHRVRAFETGDLGVRSLHGDGEACEAIDLVRLDDWIAAEGVERIDVVKMDIEGAELDALRGMEQTLARLRPRVLVLELCEALLARGGASVGEVCSWLDERGYRPFGLEGGRLVTWRPDASDPNAVFLPR